MNDKEILIWLNSINGIGIKSIEKIIDYFGSIKNVWESSNNDILGCKGLRENAKNNFIKYKNEGYVNDILEELDKEKVHTITIVDNDYPKKLKDIYCPPVVLYVKGQMVKEDELLMAMVGSRKATYYGKWVAEKIARGLARHGIGVISGLARGIDTISHIGSLDGGTKTYGVLGCGVDIVYPTSNRKLYDRIIENGGIISEYPMKTQPIAGNFPQRNRIISGLSEGVIVVEAKKKSGSLITANFALEQGKDVFAVPGNINSIYSQGTNELIRDGAKLIASEDDVICELIQLKDNINNDSYDKGKINEYILDEKEKKIVDVLKYGPMHCEMISYNTGIEVNETISILTMLEIKGIIKQMSGKIFIINS